MDLFSLQDFASVVVLRGEAGGLSWNATLPQAPMALSLCALDGGAYIASDYQK